MRLTAAAAPLATPITVSLAASLLGPSAGLCGSLPSWALLVLLGVTTAHTSAQVAVTQIIRLRASAQATRNQDAIRILEIEDLPATAYRKPGRQTAAPQRRTGPDE